MSDDPSETSDTPTAKPEVEKPEPDAAAPPQEPPWKRQLHTSLDDLKVMSHDIRQRLETAGKTAQTEAKDAWKKLEPQLHTAEKKLVEATDEAVEQIKSLFGGLRGKLENLRDKLG